MVTALKYRLDFRITTFNTILRFPINLSGSMHSLLYASAVRKSGDEVRAVRAFIPAKQVSGFIDLASRVRQESFLPYLTGQRRLRPKPGDLTYANISRYGVRQCNITNISRRKSKLCSSDIWKVGAPTIYID